MNKGSLVKFKYRRSIVIFDSALSNSNINFYKDYQEENNNLYFLILETLSSLLWVRVLSFNGIIGYTLTQYLEPIELIPNALTPN